MNRLAARQAREALDEYERQAAQLLAPDEPHAAQQTLALLDPANYRGRLWATRARPWVDRMASAWLIRRRSVAGLSRSNMISSN